MRGPVPVETVEWNTAKRKEPILSDWPFHKPRQQPTLAEAIQPLPSVMLRLTAVFGMGTGRSTAAGHREIGIRN